jgi:hypothetical protein
VRVGDDLWPQAFLEARLIVCMPLLMAPFTEITIDWLSP